MKRISLGEMQERIEKEADALEVRAQEMRDSAYETAKQVLVNEIKNLGPNVAAIRKKMKALKRRGIQGDSAKCVLAVHFASLFADKEINVNDGNIQVDGVDVDAPQHVASFISQFDEGKFPELVKGKVQKKDEGEGGSE
jgi:hypothetical protein